jgi:hypothetical protein
MHSSARRAGYPSDSSRAARHQTRTRPAGGGPLLYNYAVERRRRLRHRSRPLCGLAVPPVALDPLSARAENHRHRSRPPQRARARCTTVIVTGCGPGRCPARVDSTPGGGPAAATVHGRRSGPGAVPLGPSPERGPVGHLTVPHVADCRAVTRAAMGPDRRTASPPRDRAPGARTQAVGAVPGPDRLARSPRAPYTVKGL